MPARNFRSSRPLGARRPRRQLVWATRTLSSQAIAASGGLNVDLFSTFTQEVGNTIMRVILKLHVQNWAAEADSITYGLFAQGRASDVGTTPVLASSPGFDWMWYSQLYPSAAGAAESVAEHYDLDIKSKRRMQEQDQRFLLCFVNNSAASKTVDIFARTLVALP